MSDSELNEEVEEILFVLDERRQRHSKNYYRPLDSVRSEKVRAHYRSNLKLDENGNIFLNLKNRAGTVIARGYTRVVVGDYGAYVEFSRSQAVQEHLEEPQNERGWNKYVPFYTKDAERTKVYYQLLEVKYADYRPGMYYVGVDEVTS